MWAKLFYNRDDKQGRLKYNGKENDNVQKDGRGGGHANIILLNLFGSDRSPRRGNVVRLSVCQSVYFMQKSTQNGSIRVSAAF